MLLDTTPLTSDGEDAVSFQRDTRDMSGDEGTPPPERLTNFFIADILSPDFGRKRCAKCAVRPDGVSPSGDTWGDMTPWRVPACRGKTELEKGTSPGTKHARREEPEWPAWVYCTRYSDRPTAGPRSRKTQRKSKAPEEKRPRTAFTSNQICRLLSEFDSNRYLTEDRRRDLSAELRLSESQIKIWFQNKRAKLKKTTGNENTLAVKLRGEGLYNHAVSPVQGAGDGL